MPDLADRRKAALDELTREEIREAANRVIASHGISGLTMSMVAEEAGLAKGTLYNYFEDKNDLVFYVLVKAFEPLIEKLEEVADADMPPVEHLTSAAHAFMSGFVGRQSLIAMAMQGRTVIDPARVMPVMKRMRERTERSCTRIIKRGMDQGVFRPGDPTSVARLFLAAINGLLHPRVFAPSQRSLDDEVDELMDVFLNGIAARK
jgi:AcrR family transcriptional regulator